MNVYERVRSFVEEPDFTNTWCTFFKEENYVFLSGIYIFDERFAAICFRYANRN